ncbi:MAG: AcrB/AcrD/AcrF family protein [Elusimicrobia bacterium CG_4_10_14_0_2_um_filter_56_8]|nr:MAG: AcrB/AcrD/AcrF family protein [Elusimicrobia bacterium CG_4_10_14_0_2_um_filter_56_8]
MKITEIAVQKPIFTTMMILTIVVLGAFSYFRLGVDLFPNVEFPFVIVQTALRGAGPEEVESSITKPIEEAVNTISGIEDITSTSYEGLSIVMVKFILEKNGDVAAQEVRDKVNSVQRQLPQGTDAPMIAKFDMGATPVLNVVIYGDRDLIGLTQIAKKKIKENIETVNGVGAVDIVGGREREIHLVVNPLKLSAMNLSIKQVKDAVTQQNIEIPGGKVEQKNKEFVLRIMGRLESVKDFNDIVITNINGTPVRLSDIGRVEDTGARMTTSSSYNGTPSVTLVVKKQSGTNTVAVVKNIKARLNGLKKSLPPGVQTKIIGDQSVFIEASVSTVKEHLILGAVFAALMVLLFIGDFRSTIISSLAIPTSLIGTLIFMDLSGFTLNNMTLLGLTIAVGIVIDDAIVMLENIYRHMEEHKMSPLKASLEGSREIAFAVLAMSTALLVIFVPLAYMGGIIGRFIKSYGLTIAYAVAISTLVALTLTPMLCAIFLKVNPKGKTNLQKSTDRINEYLAKYYIKMLEWALARRKRMVAFAAAIMISMVPLFMFLGKDFLPSDDTGQYQIIIIAPEGTSLSMMKQIFAQVETETKQIPYVINTLSSIGTGTGGHSGSASPNEGYIMVEVADIKDRPLPISKLVSASREMMSKYKGLRVSVSAVGGFGGGEAELQYNISGPDLAKLQEYSSKVANALRKVKGAVDVDVSFSYAKPEYRVEIDRKRAHDLGVKVEDIATSLRTMVGGEEDITKFKDGDELYQVRLRAEESFRDRKEAIEALMIPAGVNRVTRLDNIAKVVQGVGPTQIERFNRQRNVKVLANMSGIPIGKLITEAEKAFRELNAPPEYKGGVTGKAKELGNMLKGFLIAFLMAFIFIYIVLASQFESFVHPISIMIVLPLTIPFAVISLFLSGQNLSLFSIMGIFMLFGIVKKNSILQVDYTNTLRAKGMPRYQAMIEANKTRLRPILMTTLTLIAGMIPTALGTGAGSGTRRAMAIVIIGGQTLSLLITLLMTPVTYSLFDDLEIWFRKKYMGGETDRETV